ncbi:hypothetical protein [Deinococcus cellulosilyticus]|uniref:Uncharacterized protein n=1 Tax=Deinococcus cellulosilyticus (strain DSM 18568 / NBRC 106333 / KACC 11606 / 5516J-15) TaxID=1223518 RepID=A0A511N728_DEIC1|nr:hypothetical protein [Deinococcus cellulosilyticus]GEM48659.1 hypothetical protein DC3_42940 [Deinococcus cellulosilyticus NBRC 106333 = KACC 11606]
MKMSEAMMMQASMFAAHTLPSLAQPGTVRVMDDATKAEQALLNSTRQIAEEYSVQLEMSVYTAMGVLGETREPTDEVLQDYELITSEPVEQPMALGRKLLQFYALQHKATRRLCAWQMVTEHTCTTVGEKFQENIAVMSSRPQLVPAQEAAEGEAPRALA